MALAENCWLDIVDRVAAAVDTGFVFVDRAVVVVVVDTGFVVVVDTVVDWLAPRCSCRCLQ